MSDVIDLSIPQLRHAIASGKLTAEQTTQAYLDRLDQAEPVTSAFNEVFYEQAIAQARAIDARRQEGEPLGPLAGAPLAIKDNICLAFGHTTCSSRYLATYKSPYTATSVSRLLAADAVVLGKTNLDEFGMGSSTENSAFRPTVNPWKEGYVPGGSSGGSAAAVAARQCLAALGSDTGGSIRQPAAFCGVVGIKPTYGRVSRYGLVAFGSSLDQVGPIGRDATDCAAILQAMAGHDEHDSTSVPGDVPDYLASIDRPIENLRVGLPREFYALPEALDGEIRQALDNARAVYESLGAEIVEVSLPHSRVDLDDNGNLSSYAVACYYVVCTAEASSNLARFDGVRYGRRTAEEGLDIVELYSRTRDESFGAEVKRRIMLGTYALSSGYYDQYYNKALKVRRLIKNDFDRALEACDVLLCPVSPTNAFRLGEKTSDPLEMYLGDVYTSSISLAGVPALAMPAGVSSQGLPIGMQLVGPVFGEEKLFRVARMFEQAGGPCRLRPPTV